MNAMLITPPSAAAALSTPMDAISAPQSLEVESTPPVSFMERLQSAVHAVDDDQRAAEQKLAAVDSGRSDDLVGAMLASQQASVSFAMLLQVRNKLAGALDDLLKLQL